jgi:sugar phosphate isomerase/epimerase
MLCEIAEAVNDERFGLCLDIGHAATSGTGAPVAEWAERMLPFLGHVHVHNNYGDHYTHNAPGDGLIDAAAIVRQVAEAAPAATFTIEASDGKASVAWMMANGFL